MNSKTNSPAHYSIPASIAVEMVDELFADGQPNASDQLLFTDCRSVSLITQVHQYCQQHGCDPPETVAIGIDTDVIQYAREQAPTDFDIKFRQQDFLTAQTDTTQFEYIIGDPPAIGSSFWSPSRVEEYAYEFETVGTADEFRPKQIYLLFFEQGLSMLSEGGRLVYLTPEGFVSNQQAADFRAILNGYRIDEITPVDPPSAEADVPHSITTVSNVEVASLHTPDLDVSDVHDNLHSIYPVTAADLMTKDVTGYAATERSADVCINMSYHDFDAAPVFDPETDACLGIVTRSAVNAVSDKPVRECLQSVDESCFVEPTASFADVLSALASHRVQLVGTYPDAEGIVTRFDLNKLHSYLHLYSLIANLELGLQRAIREHETEWRDAYDIYQTNMKKHYRRQRAIVADPLSCAQFSELIDIARELGVFEQLVPAWADGEVSVSDLIGLRNHVAHYTALVHTMDDLVADDNQRTAYRLKSEYDLLRALVDAFDGRRASAK